MMMILMTVVTMATVMTVMAVMTVTNSYLLCKVWCIGAFDLLRVQASSMCMAALLQHVMAVCMAMAMSMLIMSMAMRIMTMPMAVAVVAMNNLGQGVCMGVVEAASACI
jgi:hypothetical protein